MSDTMRQTFPKPGASIQNEATHTGCIFRKGDLIGGGEIEIKVPITSGEAELYMARKDKATSANNNLQIPVLMSVQRVCIRKAPLHPLPGRST